MIGDDRIRTRPKRASLIVGTALSALLGIIAAAQNQPKSLPSSLVQIGKLGRDKGLVVVKVTDETGAVVQNADVQITNEVTGQLLEGKTNKVGIFSTSGVLPSSYSVRVNALNFRSAAALHVPLPAAESREMQFALQVGEFEIRDGVGGIEVPLLPMDSNLPTAVPLAPTPPPAKANFLKRLFEKLRGK